MTIREVIHVLEADYPLEKAEEWDNSGLQVGRRNKEVKRIYVALDATDAVIAEACEWKADMLLTHHPLTLAPIRQINTDTMTGRRFYQLIQHDLCHYAMHTNYDVAEMGQAAGEMMKLQQAEVLAPTGTDPASGEPEGIGRVGHLVRPVAIEECGRIVKKIFGVDTVKIFGDPEQVIERVAICPGSGKSTIPDALSQKAEVLITGDIGHHDGIDAVDQGLAIIDAGHYGMEHIFLKRMCRYLQEHFEGMEIRAAKEQNPFVVL